MSDYHAIGTAFKLAAWTMLDMESVVRLFADTISFC